MMSCSCIAACEWQVRRCCTNLHLVPFISEDGKCAGFRSLENRKEIDNQKIQLTEHMQTLNIVSDVLTTSRLNGRAASCNCKNVGWFDFNNVCINCGGTKPPAA